jgi:hypothetical protein
MDPDLYIRERGKEEFDSLLAASKPFLEFKLERLQKKFPSQKDEVKVIQEIARTLGLITDLLKRRILAEQIGKRLSLLPETLLRAFEKPKIESKKPIQLADREVEITEYRLIGLMMRQENVREEIKKSSVIEDFSSPDSRDLCIKILSESEKMNSASLLGQDLSQNARDELARILFLEDNSFDFFQEAKGCIWKIKSKRIKEKRRALKKEMERAEGDHLRDLELEYQNISKKLTAIQQ